MTYIYIYSYTWKDTRQILGNLMKLGWPNTQFETPTCLRAYASTHLLHICGPTCWNNGFPFLGTRLVNVSEHYSDIKVDCTIATYRFIWTISLDYRLTSVPSMLTLRYTVCSVFRYLKKHHCQFSTKEKQLALATSIIKVGRPPNRNIYAHQLRDLPKI